LSSSKTKINRFQPDQRRFKTSEFALINGVLGRRLPLDGRYRASWHFPVSSVYIPNNPASAGATEMRVSAFSAAVVSVPQGIRKKDVNAAAGPAPVNRAAFSAQNNSYATRRHLNDSNSGTLVSCPGGISAINVPSSQDFVRGHL
jgi:hypothetical protein